MRITIAKPKKTKKTKMFHRMIWAATPVLGFLQRFWFFCFFGVLQWLYAWSFNSRFDYFGFFGFCNGYTHTLTWQRGRHSTEGESSGVENLLGRGHRSSRQTPRSSGAFSARTPPLGGRLQRPPRGVWMEECQHGARHRQIIEIP